MTAGGGDRLRLAVIGAGSIVPVHLRAFDRLGRTEVVGVASRTRERAAAVAAAFGGRPFDDPERMLDAVSAGVVLVATPPYRTPEICELLVARGIPFLVEKPLAALDEAAPARIAEAIEAARLVVAVGYHLRGLVAQTDLRERLVSNRPEVVTAEWLDETVGGDWWARVARSGGQLVEQATHLFDLARVLAGEATVVGAASVAASDAGGPTADVASASAAVLRFERGGVGSFVATRVLSSSRIALEVAASGLLATIARTGESDAGGWRVTIDEGEGERSLPTPVDPYEVQDAAFLDAVSVGDPSGVLCTYRDALATDRLVRAVVAATGAPG